MSFSSQTTRLQTRQRWMGALAILVILVGLGLGGPRHGDAATVRYENLSPITIPQNSTAAPYPSTITVSGLPGTITDVNVALNGFFYSFTPDARILLVGPDGTKVLLLSGPGNGAIAAPGVVLIMNQSASSGLPCGTAPVTDGSFRPTDCNGTSNFPPPAPGPPYSPNLDLFNGKNPNGTWSLYAYEDNGQSGGLSSGWNLQIVTDAPLAAQVVASSGTRYDGGAVHLEWRTSGEVDNLGFRVYRDAGQGRELVTSGLVAGSALQQGGVALSTDLSYGWWDQLDPDAGAVQYWLEAVDLAGQGTWFGPIIPRAESGPPPALRRARLLSEVGQAVPPSGQIMATSATRRVLGGEAPDLARQRELAAQPAVQIGVREPGWYRVTYEDLTAAGFAAAVDPRGFQLFLHGQEQPIQVHTAVRGQFGPGDAIGFYGKGQEDNPSTNEQVYWLVAGGGTGRPVPVIDSPAAPGGALSYAATMTWRPRTVYFANLKNGDAGNFFGPPFSGTALVQPLILNGVAPEAPGGTELTLALQGVSLVPHTVEVKLNGVVLGTVTFDGQAHQQASFPIAQALLHEGENPLTLQELGGDTYVSLVDTVQVRYGRTYTAAGDIIEASVPAGVAAQTLDGFTTPDIRVIDITDAERVIELAGQLAPTVEGYAVNVGLVGQGPRTLLAFTEAQIKAPVTLTLNTPSQWTSSPQGGDLVIITHQAFAAALEPLRQAREAEGLTVAVVNVEDVFDELSFGERSPQAVKAFLQQAWATWKPRPRYVLLVGGATYDWNNYLGSDIPDYVPTKLVDTALMETASDDWFVDFDDDGLPDLPIGRLPVRTAAEAQQVVAKLVGQGSQPGSGQTALLVADSSDPGAFDFEQVTAAVKAQLRSSMAVTEVLRRESGDAVAQQTILTTLNAGPTLVTYAGHGAYQLWRGNLLTADEASTLTNRNQWPVVAAMTCLNGYFVNPALRSLAEALLLAEGGAVAVWTSSGMDYAPGQAALLKAWVRLVASGTGLTLGEAAVQAKAATTDVDVRRTWILFGDPTMRLLK